jgi:hypothetical protein
MIFISFLACALLAAPDDSINVEKKPPTTQFIEFDPKNPPADVQKLQHGEDALTRMLFNCTVKLKYNVVSKNESDGKCRVVAALGEVHLTLELKNTIYLPARAPDKLRAHEMGHAKINGILYEHAREAAQEAAQRAMDRTWEGEGTDADAAGKAATDAAVNAICRDYLKLTADRAFRIGEIYDDLSKHGTNARTVDDAIRQAIQKEAEEKR